MQGPPSVEYPVARSRAAAWLLWTLCISWLFAQLAWAWHLAPAPPLGAWWLGLLAGMVWCGYNVWLYRQPLEGHLVWERDNRPHAVSVGRWVWYSRSYKQGTLVASPQTLLDFQHTVLVKLANAEGLVWWLWLERRRQPADWDDLRRALGYSRRR